MAAAATFGFMSYSKGMLVVPTLCWLFFAALCLCMTLHVTAHEVLHRHLGGRWHSGLGFLLTLLLGISYRYYRIHHYNHHRHDNGTRDFSCTWKVQESQWLPRNFWTYGLLWPLGMLKLPKQIQQSLREGLITPAEVGFFAIESLFGIVASFTLATLMPHGMVWLAEYTFMVYWGWVFISWHNYGQHLPIQVGAPLASVSKPIDIKQLMPHPEAGANAHVNLVTSFPNALYNNWTHDNGLHAEHHAHPNTPTHLLHREALGLEIGAPHLWTALRARTP